MQCESCRREIEQGKNVSRLQPGINNNERFVEVGADSFFCGEDCLLKFLSGGGDDVIKVKRRVA
jgi:hypothetical protein